MCTLGRYKEPEEFLKSLTEQTYSNFELIVIDQNDNNKIEMLCKKFSNNFSIVYERVTFKGLSRARNWAFKYVTGNVVGFPDDDCVYYKDTLYKVSKYFSDNIIDCITGKYVCTKDCYASTESNSIQLNKYNIWMHSISFTVFLKKSSINVIGLFDQDLGVGSGTEYGSGEETDYLIRGLSKGLNMINVPDIYIYHPAPNYTSNAKQKFYRYSYGRMHVLGKHKYNKAFVFLNLVWPLVKMTMNFVEPNKRLVFWYQFKGRFDYLRRKI